MGNGKEMDKGSAWIQLAVAVAIVAVGLLYARVDASRAWGLELVLMVFFVALSGRQIKGLWRGALIDERNKISLSRLQMIAWTVVVLSAYLTAALARVAEGQADPLAVAVPSELWILLGISTTSLVGSPLIKKERMQKEPRTDEAKRRLAVEAPEGKCDHAIGTVATNRTARQASWSDMFRGEGVLNCDVLDLSKIQMFFFTAVLVVSYAAAVGRMFVDGQTGSLPAVPESMNVLLGISHTGYLTAKATAGD